VQNTAKHVSSNRKKMTSVDERSFVPFIIALRQIEASSRAAEDNVNHSEVE